MALSKIDVANMLTGVTPVANGGTAATTLAGAGLQKPNLKPIWINGDMAVSQRATSATGKTAGGYYTVDRIKLDISGTIGTWTVAQESLTSGDAFNNGFANAYRIDCTSATASPASGAFLKVISSFEGQDLQMFKKGTSNAEKFTLSFWVKSNRTGTAQVNLRDMDNTRMIGASYSISSADTWEHKVCNFAADTTGDFDDDNAQSLLVEWWLDGGSDYTSGAMPTAWEARAAADSMAAGSLDMAGSTDNDWAITGVQLEVGEYTSSTLPPFQHEDFGTNMARCQRYFTMVADGRLGGGSNEAFIGAGYCHAGNTNYFACGTLPVRMRTIDPSIFTVTGTNNYKAVREDGEDTFDSIVMYGQYNQQVFSINGTGNVSATQGTGAQVRLHSTSTYFGVDAEL